MKAIITVTSRYEVEGENIDDIERKSEQLRQNAQNLSPMPNYNFLDAQASISSIDEGGDAVSNDTVPPDIQSLREIGDDINNEVDQFIAQHRNRGATVHYSAYRRDNQTGKLVNNLHETPIQGKAKFVETGDGFFGTGESYESEVVVNPTWKMIALLADDMIQATGDRHHAFLEGIEKKGEEDGVQVYEFIMGS